MYFLIQIYCIIHNDFKINHHLKIKHIKRNVVVEYQASYSVMIKYRMLFCYCRVTSELYSYDKVCCFVIVELWASYTVMIKYVFFLLFWQLVYYWKASLSCYSDEEHVTSVLGVKSALLPSQVCVLLVLVEFTAATCGIGAHHH